MWETKKLPEICEILDKHREPINNSERNKRIEGKGDDELFPYFGATGQVGFIDDYLLDGEYVLLGEDGAPFLEAFKSPAYLVSGKIWVNNHAHVLKAKKSNKFLLYYLSQIDYREYVSGTTRLKLTQTSMKNIEVPDPPLQTQHRIVEKIEELFSELDNGVANLKKAQQQLKTYRQAVLKDAFEGKLTAAWREQQTDLPSPEELLQQIEAERKVHRERELAEWEEEVEQWEKDGKPGRKPAKPRKVLNLDLFTNNELCELDELPKLWKWVKVDRLIDHDQYSLKAGPFGSALKKEIYVEEGYKVYGQEQVIGGDPNIGDYFIDQGKYDELSSCIVKPNDVLISLVGTVGKVLILPEEIVPGVINPRLVKITLNSGIYNARFFKYYFESSYLKSLYSNKTHGATMDVLNLSIIKELPFPLLSQKEQDQIVQEIESRLSIVDQLEKTIEENLLKAEALRQSILKKAFSGELIQE